MPVGEFKRRTCDEGHPAWSSTLTECPVCTGHKKLSPDEPALALLDKERGAWNFGNGCVDPVAYETGQGRHKSNHVGAR